MRRILFAFAAFLTLAAAFAQLNKSASASVQQFLDERTVIERLNQENRNAALSTMTPIYVAPRVINGIEMIDAFIDIDDKDVLPVLEAHGVAVNCEFDGFVTAQIPVSRLNEVSCLPGVSNVEISRRLDWCTDSSLIATHAGQVLDGTEYGLPQAYDGTGVIIGVIDNGFDYQHSAFKTADSLSRSRIVRVYDVTNDAGHPALIDGTALPGSIFMDEQIDTLTRDGIGTHGTHTASIAAGTHIDGYGGMAPGADFVLCVSPTLNQGVSEVEVVNCIKYINAYADSVGKPCVISVSVSTPNGPHDGKDRISKAVAQTTGPGHIFVIAAGNTAIKYLYSHGPATLERPHHILLGYYDANLHADASCYYPNLWMESWGRKSNVRLVVAMHIYDKEEKRIVWESEKIGLYKIFDPSDFAPYFVPDLSVDSTAFVKTVISQYSSGKYEMSTTISNLKCSDIHWDATHEVYVSRYQLGLTIYAPQTLYPRQPDSCYVDTWICTTQAGRFSYDNGAYVDSISADGDTISTQWVSDFYMPATDYCSIGTYAVHDSIISAGGYVGRNSFYSMALGTTMVSYDVAVGGLYNASSYELEGYGPTGKALPTTVAPAYNVVAAVSRYSFYNDPNKTRNLVRRDADGSLWGAMTGTSMAAPTVAGIIAQWLQIKPDLTPSEVKDIIAHTAIKDDFYTPRFGPNGKIDAMAGAQYLLSLMPVDIILGDVDGSGKVDIDDITMMIDKVLGRPTPDMVEEAADFNGDSRIDIDDITDMIHFVLCGY